MEELERQRLDDNTAKKELRPRAGRIEGEVVEVSMVTRATGSAIKPNIKESKNKNKRNMVGVHGELGREKHFKGK